MENRIYNVNVEARTRLPSPAEVRAELPMPEALEGSVLRHRRVLQDILDGRDPRLFVVVGPCSIHDTDAAWSMRSACASWPMKSRTRWCW